MTASFTFWHWHGTLLTTKYDDHDGVDDDDDDDDYDDDDDDDVDDDNDNDNDDDDDDDNDDDNDDDDDNYDDNYDDDDDEDDDNCLMTSLVVSVRSVPPWQHGRDVVQVLSPHFWSGLIILLFYLFFNLFRDEIIRW